MERNINYASLENSIHTVLDHNPKWAVDLTSFHLFIA